MELSGGVQKGPFVIGSSVVVSLLDEAGNQTGVDFNTRTTNDMGEFTVQLPSDAYNSQSGESYLSLEASGFYYNEITGELSDAPIVLRAFAGSHLDDAQSEVEGTFINIITHLTYDRVEALLRGGVCTREGRPAGPVGTCLLREFQVDDEYQNCSTVEGATLEGCGGDLGLFRGSMRQAEYELSQALQLLPSPLDWRNSSDTRIYATDMNMLGADETWNAYLLAVSAVLANAAQLAGGPVDAALQELLNTISLDLADDGQLDRAVRDLIQEAARTLDVETVLDQLAERLASIGSAATVPTDMSVWDFDGDSYVGSQDCRQTDPLRWTGHADLDEDGNDHVDCSGGDCDDDDVQDDAGGCVPCLDCATGECVGSACSAETEDNDTTCADELDNDNDGFVDCADWDCLGNEQVLVCSRSEDNDAACSDGYDNDENGFLDCLDWGCSRNEAVTVCPSSPEDDDESCSDEADNDLNSYVDCEDWGCLYNPEVTVCGPHPEDTDQACSDSRDNDGDDTVDCEDWDCLQYTDVCMVGTEADDSSCADGQDNDGNGFTDCVDWSCSRSETVTVCGGQENTLTTCRDGFDNDDNTFIDCYDLGCVGVMPACDRHDEDTNAACSDGRDNDFNGFVDCLDWSCARNPDISSCQLCGDGYLQFGEVCDDGNLDRDDGCEPECVWTCSRDGDCPQASCFSIFYCDLETHLCVPTAPNGCDPGLVCSNRECRIECEWPDEDGDGSIAIVEGCGGDDCNDTDPSIHPGATEVLDDVDNDCDGALNEGFSNSPRWVDCDRDGYATLSAAVTYRSNPTSNETGCNGAWTLRNPESSRDCDDSNAARFPSAREIVGNSVDENCDGRELCYESEDDDFWTTGEVVNSADADCEDSGEWHFPEHWGRLAQEGDPWLQEPFLDCCDTDPNVHPGQAFYFSTISECISFDYNCSSTSEIRHPFGGLSCGYLPPILGVTLGGCTTSTSVSGWVGGAPPCGVSGLFAENCHENVLGLSCTFDQTVLKQPCR